MPSADYNGGQLVAVCITFLILTYISVFLRCFVRIKLTDAFQLDDWFMVMAQLVFTFSCSFILRGVHYGLGRHNSTLSQDNEIQALKYQALATLTYVANMMFIKLSICVFLLRVAVLRRYIWILRISMVIVTLWSMGIFIYDIFQCTPIPAQWDSTIKGARCVGSNSVVSAAYSISVLTILTDWLYALLPIPMVWNVKMSPQAKYTVTVILSLGIFASVATIIRLRYLMNLNNVDDILFAGTNPMIWTLVEPGVAIFAASLVTIRPLLRVLNFTGFGSTNQPADSETGGNGSHALRPSLRKPSKNWSTDLFTVGGTIDEELVTGGLGDGRSGKDSAQVQVVANNMGGGEGNSSQECIL